MTTAAVVSVGDELLVGEVLDTNAGWLAERLTELGVEVRRIVASGDDEDDLTALLSVLVADHDVVVVGGGLGPTSDDRTREAVAAACGIGLEHRDDLMAAIAERYRSLDLDMPAANRRQARVPVGAEALPAVGTAPGFVVRTERGLVAAMPGVPWELREMWASLEPHLVGLDGVRPSITRVVSVSGLGESNIAALLEPLEDDLPEDVSIAYLASGGIVRVKLTARADDRDLADARVAPLHARVAELLGDAVVATDGATLEEVVVRRLTDAGLTVAVAESATGGLVAQRISAVPGASAVLRGGLVVYTEDAKRDLAGVDAALLAEHGPVSREVTEALAVGVRDRLGADLGIATTGVAGPATQGGRPVGTMVWALADRNGVTSWERILPGDRDHVRRRLATAALEALRRA